jgi:hypothetical protein
MAEPHTAYPIEEEEWEVRQDPRLGPVKIDPNLTPAERALTERYLAQGGGAPASAPSAPVPAGPDAFERQLAAEKQAYQEQVAAQVAEQKAFNERAKAAALAAREERKPEWEALRERQRAYEQTPPPVFRKPPEAPQTQKMLEPTSLQKTLGMASVFSLLSVGLAKGSAIYGIRALGGFMQGAREGQMQTAEAALKDYNAKMKEVQEANQTALEEYNAIIGNRKMSLETQAQMLRIKALEFQDDLTIQSMEQGGLTAVNDRLNKLADMNFKYTAEIDRHQQIQAQMAHYRAMEAKQAKTEAAALKQSDINAIETAADREMSRGLPRDAMGNVILGPEWGATVRERQDNYARAVDRRKRQLAAQRGLAGIFDKEPTSEDPAMALRHAINSGEVSKSVPEAQAFLARRGITGPQAVAIIQQVANEPFTEY